MDFYNINGVNLDEYQIKAIEDNSKSILVCAGAGSGKSLTILGYIKYLIEKKKVLESDILCISFTNESVNSLKNKILNLGYDVDTYTFHKLALKILEENNISLASDNLLDYIINEYFNSYIEYNKRYKKEVNKYKFINYDIKSIKDLISRFIRLAKSNDYKIKDIYKIYRRSVFIEKQILKHILNIYLIYERELESSNKMDFDDLIIKARSNINVDYKYIIIDEFQDTSYVRYLLINEIIKRNNAHVFVVGDDYQSIYRFSGCDLDIFINFNKYFDCYKRHDLNNTYRNSKELIYVSVNFIMKNKRQLKKQIKSNKSLDKPIKIVYNHDVLDIINLINKDDILIIGRNNKDIKDIEWENKLTIHRSKGLEAENVILVNSDSIPSKIKNEKLLRHVLRSKDYIIYEEERRLFYVALTRTKNNIYIMVNKKMSPFVKELISNYKDYIEIIS